MNKKEYLAQLEKRLSSLPKEERNEAVSFYKELIEESPNEESAISNLPTPKKLAANLILEFGLNHVKDKKIPILTIVLAVLSAPITIPIILVVLIMIISLLILLGAVIFTLGLIFISVFLIGIVAFIAFFAALNYSTGTIFTMLGIALIAFSLSYILLIMIRFIAKKSIEGIKFLAKKMISRRSKIEK